MRVTESTILEEALKAKLWERDTLEKQHRETDGVSYWIAYGYIMKGIKKDILELGEKYATMHGLDLDGDMFCGTYLNLLELRSEVRRND